MRRTDPDDLALMTATPPAPAAPPSPSADADTLERLLAARFSCRGFKPDPVPQPVIERILGMAQHTASWCNAQPWQVVVTRGAATERFRQAMLAEATSGSFEATPDFAFPHAYRGVYQERRRACGLALYDAVGVARGDRAASARQGLQNFALFGAPHVAIVTTDEGLGVYGVLDCGAYVSNFMVAATSLGVASIAQAALASRPRRVREHFGLGADRLVVCGISLGYADPDHPANRFRTGRAAIGDAVTWCE